MTATNISEEMLGAVGRTLSESVSFPISASDIRKWALAVYYPEEPPRLYWDEAYAATTPFGGIVAPEDFNPFAWMAAEPAGLRRAMAPTESDGTQDSVVEGQLGIKGPGLKFIVNGGMVVEYGPVRMRPGDVIRSVSTFAGYHEREGRLGLMLLSTTETRWTNQRDELVKTTRGTLIRY